MTEQTPQTQIPSNGPWSLVLLCAVTLFPSCSAPRQPPTNSSPKASEFKGQSSNVVDTEQNAQKSDSKKAPFKDPRDLFSGDTLIDAHYVVKTATLGTQTCTGSVNIKVFTALKKGQPMLQFPEGTLDCGPLGKADIKPLLKVFTLVPSDDNVEVLNNTIRMKKMGTLSYSPSRPYMPSFLAAKASDLEKLNILVPLEAFDDKTQSKTSGVCQIRMMSFGKDLRSTEFKRTFHDVMQWEKIESGFEGIDRVSNGLADRIEWTMSLNPLAILSIKIQAPAKDLMDSFQNTEGILSPQMEALIKAMPKADGTGMIDQLIGKDFEDFTKGLKVELEAVLVDQKNLSPNFQDDETTVQAEDDKVKIGK